MPRILIVEDEPQLLAMLSAVLEDEGYAVQTAADGLAALDLITASPPDLLITDVMMPRLDGWALLARVREQDQTLPVIVMSAVDLRLRRQEAPLPDHTVFLPKPFDIATLLANISRLTRL